MKTTFYIDDEELHRLGPRTLTGEFEFPFRFNIGDSIDIGNSLQDINDYQTMPITINDKDGWKPCPEYAMQWLCGNGCRVDGVEFGFSRDEIFQTIWLELK